MTEIMTSNETSFKTSLYYNVSKPKNSKKSDRILKILVEQSKIFLRPVLQPTLI